MTISRFILAALACTAALTTAAYAAPICEPGKLA